MVDHEMKTDQSGQKNGDQEQPAALFCRKCGSLLGTGARFCGACGTPVETGSATGQELQQLADSAKAVAKAGMDSARKNAAKGMELAGEKMSAAAEKMRQNKQVDSASSEMGTEKDSEGTIPKSPEKSKQTRKAVVRIVVIIIVVYFLAKLFSRNPVGDIQDVVFDQYGSQTLGEAVKNSIPKASWDSEKLGDKHYAVTLSGFCPDISSNIQVEFDVNYSGDYIYAKPIDLIMDGEHYDDIFSIALVMGIIYE